ncbi:MAG TPA: multifunctional CCA tRNA nucleotidyl transferase/2'3'-cyclic phosphodiesterase/2'nucleotidase/phosphatase, partial [Gammaproteobacteria bacterium]
IPNDYRELAQIVTRYHGVYHRVEELRASTLHDTLEAVDAFRRPERFEQFLLACEADSRGRIGFEELQFAQPALLREALHAAQQVSARAVVADGYSGKAVGEQLRVRRIAAIRQALKLSMEEPNG